MGRKGSGSGLSGLKLLAVTFKQLMQRKQILLLPITMFIGAEQAYMAVGFTAVSIRFQIVFFCVRTEYRRAMIDMLLVLCWLWLGN